jgi:hypothetical protein
MGFTASSSMVHPLSSNSVEPTGISLDFAPSESESGVA